MTYKYGRATVFCCDYKPNKRGKKKNEKCSNKYEVSTSDIEVAWDEALSDGWRVFKDDKWFLDTSKYKKGRWKKGQWQHRCPIHATTEYFPAPKTTGPIFDPDHVGEAFDSDNS